MNSENRDDQGYRPRRYVVRLLSAICFSAAVVGFSVLLWIILSVPSDAFLDSIRYWSIGSLVSLLAGLGLLVFHFRRNRRELETMLVKLQRADRRSQALILDAEESLLQQQKNNKLMQMLMHVASASNESHTLADAIQRTLDEVCRYIEWDVGHAYLYKEHRDILVSMDCWYVSDYSKYRTFIDDSSQTSFEPEQGMIGRTYAAAQPMWDENISEDSSFVRQKSYAACGLKAAFAFPVIIDGKVVVVMEFFSSKENEADLQLLQVMGNVGEQLGHAIARAQSESKARLFEEIVTNANDGVIITKAGNIDNPGPEIVYANAAFCRMTGYALDEIIGQTPRMLQGEDSDRATLDAIRESLIEGRPYKGELINYTKEGQKYWVDINIVPMFDAKGNLTNFAAIERDITEQKNKERDLLDSVLEAERANQTKTDFLANMSHELRTPMNGILGMCSLLQDTPMDDEQIELVNTIYKSSDNLLMLLNDILDLSKVESGDVTIEKVPYNIHQEMKDAERLYGANVKEKSLELQVNISENVPECILGDYIKIQQVVRNLMSNAIKFTHEGGITISIAVHKDEFGDGSRPEIYFYVKDTGIGIPEDRLEDIFSKFTQADASTTRKYGGTGLGLAIVKELVELMGGRIGVESHLGKGTIFYFALPLEVPAEGERPVNIPEPAKGDAYMIYTTHATAKILVVDDNPVNRLFAEKILKKMGYENVELAEDGAEALEKMWTYPYDIVFMDCQMPEMDGYEATRRYRAYEESSDERVPVIAVTANAIVGDKQKCLAAGMDDYLSKPLKRDKLQEMLDKWLQINADENIEDTASANGGDPTIGDPKVPPIDMEHLSMFTDGDPEEEKELFDLFLEQAELSVSDLASTLSATPEEWRQAAHRFKGSAANLGASVLASLCKKAEEECESTVIDKESPLNSISGELDHIRQFIERRAS